MKALLVYPEHSDTFWSFKSVLKIVSKKAAFPPLGLLTVAAMLPEDWEKRLVDMNVAPLSDNDLLWSDYVFLGAIAIQQESACRVIERANLFGKPVVAGGPLFTSNYADFKGVSHFVLNEAEATMPAFLADLEKGAPKPVYSSTDWPDITQTAIPAWDLIDMRHYLSMSVQLSRGCPYDCEFCDIAFLNGKRPRSKTVDQFIAELDALYSRGWRGYLLVVDDNFIGNRNMLKEGVLPAVIEWVRRRGHPFSFNSQVSVDLADDDDLLRLMVEAGFITAFVGIETPNQEGLTETNKKMNLGRDLLASVRKIQRSGLQVQGGFIVGFDSDRVSTFQQQINFIQTSGIVMAMVGVLNALPGSRLYQRLKMEGRLLGETTGNNMDGSTNFQPRMGCEALSEGYSLVLESIYSPSAYYQRIRTFLDEYEPRRPHRLFLRLGDLRRPRELWPVLKVTLVLGFVDRERGRFWSLLAWTLRKHPGSIREALTCALYGIHFRRVVSAQARVSSETYDGIAEG